MNDIPYFARYLPIRNGELHFLCPAGMGDFTWIWAKHWKTAQERDVTFHFPKSEVNRAWPLVQMYGAKYNHLEGLTTDWVWSQPGSPEIPDSGAVLVVHCNRHLENGKRIEKWYPDIPFRIPAPVSNAVSFYKTCDRPPYVMCFMCQHGYMEKGGNLLPAMWGRLLKEIERNVAPVRLIGAGLDEQLIKDVCEVYAPSLEPFINMPLSQLVAEMGSVMGMFGAAGGPTILSTYLGIPTLHLYPRHLVKMPGMWEHPEAISDWRFLDEAVLAGTVDQLAALAMRAEQ